MRFRLKPTIRSALRTFAAVAIGCQFLVPTGYMPGSFANGTPFMLCDMFRSRPAPHAPAQMGAMHSDMPDMAAHLSAAGEHDEHLGEDAWEHCPLGSLSSGAPLASTFDPAIDVVRPDSLSILPTAQLRSVSIVTVRARAPPVPAIQPNA